MTLRRFSVRGVSSAGAILALAVAASSLPAPPVFASPQGAGDGFLGPRGTFDWLAYAFLPPELWTGSIMIKIREGEAPALKDHLIVDGKGAPLVDVAALVPEGSLLSVTQGFGIGAEKLKALKSSGERRCRCELAEGLS